MSNTVRRGIHRLVRILEDHLHVAAKILGRARIECRDVGEGTFVHLDLDGAAGGVIEPHQHSASRRLAAARFAHQPQALARSDFEVDSVDRVDEVRGGPEEALGHRI